MSFIDRLRIVLDDYAIVVLVVGLVLVAGGVALTYSAHVGEETNTETVVTETWEEETTFTHSAEVTETNPVFQTGAVLEGQSQYYKTISPTLTGEYQYHHTGQDPRSVTLSVSLVVRSVDGDGGVFWEEREQVDQVEQTAVPAGERVTGEFEVDVPAVEQRIAEIEDGLGATLGSPEAAVVVDVIADTDDGPRTVDTDQLVVDPGGSVYSVNEPESMHRSHDRTEQQEVPVEPSSLQLFGGPLLMLLGITVVGGMIVADRTGRLTVPAQKRSQIAFEQTKTELDDWITVGSVPPSAKTETTVRVNDLEGLVDIAIDADGRVIEDQQSGTFYLIGERITYLFVPEIGSSQLDPDSAPDDTADDTEGEFSEPAAADSTASKPTPADPSLEGNLFEGENGLFDAVRDTPSTDSEATDSAESSSISEQVQTNGDTADPESDQNDAVDSHSATSSGEDRSTTPYGDEHGLGKGDVEEDDD